MTVKRKVSYKAASNQNKTPTESLSKDEVQADFAEESPMKGFNRNTKHGREGRS
ncbi:hypothetical protein [Bacillus sp. HMF5848]|uniref:hypothetical protein n=1 Tax=Bacillus sp. HMF5848 TaxID=2495421 RepID=UPI001639E173|nr:hypothetical protein [Bacillus sp. HMF5848]